jgi:hypothetical protein
MPILLLACLVLRPAPLHVEGNQLVDDGKTVTLKGVTIPSFESTNQGEFVFRSARVAFEDWGANCVCLPLSEDRWFGKSEGQKDNGANYQAAVDEVVTLAVNRRQYIVLQLASTGAGKWGKDMGRHTAPDDHAIQFWRDMAAKYRGEPRVLFGLFSRPTGDETIWKTGGDVKEGDLSFHTPGIQALLEAVRKSRSKNVCVVDMPANGKDLQAPPIPDPNGSGVVIGVRLGAQTDWGPIDSVAKTSPVVIDDVDSSLKPGPVFEFLNRVGLSWTGFPFAPKTTPSIITDWVYTPAPDWGVRLKAELAPKGAN